MARICEKCHTCHKGEKCPTFPTKEQIEKQTWEFIRKLDKAEKSALKSKQRYGNETIR